MKTLIILTSLFLSFNVMGEKIDVDFDQRTKVESDIFIAGDHDDVVMGWFYANGNKQMLLNVNHNKDMKVGFKSYVKAVDFDLSPYEKVVFELPINVLTLAKGGHLYKSLLSDLYYPTYFN